MFFPMPVVFLRHYAGRLPANDAPASADDGGRCFPRSRARDHASGAFRFDVHTEGGVVSSKLGGSGDRFGGYLPG